MSIRGNATRRRNLCAAAFGAAVALFVLQGLPSRSARSAAATMPWIGG